MKLDDHVFSLTIITESDCMFPIDRLRAPRQAQQPNKKGLKAGTTGIVYKKGLKTWNYKDCI